MKFNFTLTPIIWVSSEWWGKAKWVCSYYCNWR